MKAQHQSPTNAGTTSGTEPTTEVRNTPQADSEDSDTHAGQEGDRVDATLRNVSEGYGGPKVDEHRKTPREVARRNSERNG
jgi:hypothetical protein